MKVAIAHTRYSGFFKNDFPQAYVIGEEKVPDDLDLLILTGGEDVNPKRYDQIVTGAFGWSDSRDAHELRIIEQTVTTTKAKIFGVCRGLQILNVAFGGDLYQDIVPEHKDVHRLNHIAPNPLSWMTVVNSLHHQAIGRVGHRYEKGKVLALESSTDIPEMASWGERFLGVQFHPEFYDDDLRTQFFDVIKSWVKGDISFNVNTPLFKRSGWMTSIEMPVPSVSVPADYQVDPEIPDLEEWNTDPDEEEEDE